MKVRLSRLPRHKGVIVSVLALAVSHAAYAQDQVSATSTPSASAAAANDGQSAASATGTPTAAGEIVVTARFRNEKLRDVPIAISVVSGATATSQNLNNIQDIARVLPAVNFRTGQSNKDRTIFIRGVGTIATSPGVESSVSTVLDGVVLVRPGQMTFDLLDLERLEVLRGPQGTLFGKNASAGVVNIVTKTPDRTPEHILDLGAYQGGEYRAQALISGPLTGNTEYSLGGFYGKYRGNVYNLADGHHVNGYERYGVRGKLVLHPTEDIRVLLIGDYTHSWDNTPTAVYASSSRVAFPTNVVTPSLAFQNALVAQGTPPSGDNKTINSTFDSHVKDRNYGVSANVEWTLGDYTVTSISAWRGWRNHQFPDWDGHNVLAAGVPQGVDDGQVRFHQVSQELRLASPRGGLIDYVLGLYFLNAKTDEIYSRSVTQLVGGAPVANRGVARYGVNSFNYAAFGEANVHPTDKLTFLVGARVIKDHLSFYETRVSDTATGVPGIRPSFSATPASTGVVDWSGRAGVQYKITPRMTGYFTVSRGYKGPAFNPFFNQQAFDTAALKPETSLSYELGLKGSILNGLIDTSLAGFITHYDGFQANYNDVYLGAPVLRLINAGKVSSKGVEFDVTAHPLRGLNLTVAGSRLNAKIDSFACPAGATNCVSINGQPLPYAPKWKVSGNASYQIPLTNELKLELQSDYTYQTKTQYSLSETPDTIQPAYGIWNASIGLIDRRNWEAHLVVKNIADKHYSSFLSYGVYSVGVARFVPRDNDRYFGGNVRLHF